ncbi:MAG: tRNA-dihydrouridine synthase family protein [Bacteriovoracales bacterium]|nr:tRNA-dihydrouridine synthase family protein [Bacteriovoracales bacterium]
MTQSVKGFRVHRMELYAYSPSLQTKIDRLLTRKRPPTLKTPGLSSPFLLAPMAAIGNAPFRLLMQNLGHGGAVSEFISCKGILHGNRRTREMLRIDPGEKNVGIQLYGHDPDEMSRAALIAEESGAQFIDINMGCPVRKVVGRGEGAAMLKDPVAVGRCLEALKKVLSVPLTIKIRTGWDEQSINGDEICHVAAQSGVSMVSVHGRTRAQGYRGKCDWDYIENLALRSPLPIVGNGDLHCPRRVRARAQKTHCGALMIARGCLRNPFIFLESYLEEDESSPFVAQDYLEVLMRFREYVCAFFPKESHQISQVRKLVLWFAYGFPGAVQFRSKLFLQKSMKDLMIYAQDYFAPLGTRQKSIDYNADFMMSGHG